MVTIYQIKEGASRYLEAEMLPKLPGWRKWVAGAFALEYLSRLEDIAEELRKKPAIEMLAVMREDGMVDVDRLRDAFIRQARASGDVTVDLPAIGSVTIGERDIDMLYRYITGGM